MNSCPVCHTRYDPSLTGGPCPRCSLTGALALAAAPVAAGDYEFVAELGRGGMGVVSLARQRSLDRLVALKVIAGPSDGADGRLQREARAAAAIQHPHVVGIYEVGQGASGTYIAMEYCENGDLRARLRREPLSPRAAAELVGKLAAAVDRAHALGVLHRDLKPANVLLTSAGEPKLTDFGLSASTSAFAGDQTRRGEIAGSPSYLPPEALVPGTAPAPAGDVYGLGAILYECVTGRAPFTGDSAASVLAQIPAAEPVAPRQLNPGVPVDLQTIILKCLEKSPSARYAGAAALRDDLQAFLAGRPIAARPVSAAGRAWRWARREPGLSAALAAIAVVLAGSALGAGLAAWRIEQEQERTAVARDRALTAEQETRRQLRDSLLTQARALRLGGRAGQRTAALAALREAALIRPDVDLRNEAIAALTLPEWTPETETRVWQDPGLSTAVPLPGFAAFIHETEAGVFSRRKFPGGETEWTWADAGAPSAGQTVVSPDGRWFAVRLRNDTIHVRDARTGAALFQLENRPFAFKASRIWGYGVDMAFSPDGARFAATRPAGGLSIHAVPDGAPVAEWNTDAWLVTLAWSRHGRWLAAGGSTRREHNLVALLDAADGRELARDRPLSRVDFLDWSDDDRWLAVGSQPMQVRASADFSVRTVLPDRGALHARFLPGGDQLLLSQQVGQTKLWNIDAGTPVVVKQDGGRPGTWFDGAPLRQWRYFSRGVVALQTLEPSPVWRSHRLSPTTASVPNFADPLDLSPDGRWLLVGNWQRPSAVAVATGQAYPLGEIGAHPGSRSVGRFAGDGTTVWIGQSQGPLRRHVFSTDDAGQPQIDAGEIVPGQDGFLPTALHRATGRLVLSNFHSGHFRLLDTATQRVIAEWPLARANLAAFSPDGKWTVSSGEPTGGSALEVRDAATGEVVRRLAPRTGSTVAWRPDGRQLVAGTDDKQTQLWETALWQPGPALPAVLQHFGARAAYSPDSRWLVAQGERALHLLRADTLELLARLEVPDPYGDLPGLRFSDDGRWLIAARGEGRVDFWDFPALRAELRKLGLDWED